MGEISDISKVYCFIAINTHDIHIACKHMLLTGSTHRLSYMPFFDFASKGLSSTHKHAHTLTVKRSKWKTSRPRGTDSQTFWVRSPPLTGTMLNWIEELRFDKSRALAPCRGITVSRKWVEAFHLDERSALLPFWGLLVPRKGVEEFHLHKSSAFTAVLWFL